MRGEGGSFPLKRADLALLLALLLLSFLPLLLPGREQPAAVYADITLKGQHWRRVELTGRQGAERITVETAAGRNVLEVRGGSIAVVEADCPDGLCIKAGRLSRPGDVAACLPHGLLLEVKGSAAPAEDAAIMAY